MIDAVLDHVAVAAERASDLWPRYAGELAGEWVGGGESIGFDSGQVGYANGMRLEGLARSGSRRTTSCAASSTAADRDRIT